MNKLVITSHRDMSFSVVEGRNNMEGFRLEEYLSRGTQRIVNEILKASIDNPKQSLFMLQYAGAARAAEKLRKQRKYI